MHSLSLSLSLSLSPSTFGALSSSAFAARSGGAGKAVSVGGDGGGVELIEVVDVEHGGPIVGALHIPADGERSPLLELPGRLQLECLVEIAVKKVAAPGHVERVAAH